MIKCRSVEKCRKSSSTLNSRIYIGIERYLLSVESVEYILTIFITFSKFILFKPFCDHLSLTFLTYKPSTLSTLGLNCCGVSYNRQKGVEVKNLHFSTLSTVGRNGVESWI